MKLSKLSLNDVVQNGLCTRCGSCYSTCTKNAVSFPDPFHGHLPKIDLSQCDNCKAPCLNGCSGHEVDFPKLNEFLFNDRYPHNPFLGFHKKIFVGHSNDSLIRKNAASGGIITQILVSLLEQNIIKGAIVTRMNKDKPYLAEPFLAKTREEILESSQSKYSIIPMNKIFESSQNEEGPIAFVGIPCQIHSIRKLQQIGSPLVKNISLVVGSYCGNTLELDSVKMFLNQHGIKDLSQIEKLEYRAGEWPGFMRVTLKNGEIIQLKKFYANYLIPFYMMDRCFTCTDLTNEFSDISCGDAWSPVYEERGLGWSTVIARSEIGLKTVEKLLSQNQITLNEISASESTSMHAHMLDFKKRGAFIRMKLLKMFFKHTPNYNYEPIHIPFSRWRFEIFLSSVFVLLRTRLSFFILPYIPVSFIGKYFDNFRLFWKKKTLKAKKNNLFKTDFNYDKN